MARPIWKGRISFGLVHIPVVLHGAERRGDLQFRMLDSRNNARVRYERVNETTGQEVPWNDVVKAYEYDENNYVVLRDEDFKRAAPEATQSVEIEGFVPLGSIEPAFFDRPYYLAPAKHGEKGYALLREAMKRAKKVGIARVVIRTREHLAALIPNGNLLLLNLLRFNQELLPPKELGLDEAELSKQKPSPRELEMAEQLVETMAMKWQPAKFHDEYRDALMKWIEKKARMGGKALTAREEEPEAEPAPTVVNIMDLLKKSLKTRPAGRPKAGKKRAPAVRRKASA